LIEKYGQESDRKELFHPHASVSQMLMGEYPPARLDSAQPHEAAAHTRARAGGPPARTAVHENRSMRNYFNLEEQEYIKYSGRPIP